MYWTDKYSFERKWLQTHRHITRKVKNVVPWFCRHVAGVAGHWLFHSSDQNCESGRISYDYLCRSWYTRELLTRFYYYSYYYYYYSWYYYYNPFRWLTPCPCWLWQVGWDWRYLYDWRTRCATLRWGTRTQVLLLIYYIFSASRHYMWGSH